MAKSRIAKAYVQLVPSMDGFSKNLNTQMAGVNTSSSKALGSKFAGGFNSGFAGVKNGIANTLKAGMVVGGAAIVGAGIGLKKSITNASDFNEAKTAVESVFGSASSTIYKFAETSATAFGLSKTAALDGAKNFGIFAKSAGLSGEAGVKFSTDLLGLSADLASFNNTTVDEAMVALSSGLRGESEPLRQFGVLLDDATLRQEALKIGIISSTKDALTPQQRVLAANAVIFKQTATQQGDFSKTAGGLANQQRILAAQLENVSIKLGEMFLPIAVKIVGWLNTTMIPMLDKLVDKFKKTFSPENTSGATGMFDKMKNAATTFWTAISPIFQALAPVFGQLWEAIKNFGPTFMDLFTQFSPLTIILTSLKDVLPQIAEALGSVLAVLGPALLQIVAALMPTIGKLAEVLGKVIVSLVEALLPVILILAEALVPIIDILGEILIPIFDALSPLIAVLVDIIGQSLIVVLEALQPILLLVGDILKSFSPYFKDMIPQIKIWGQVLKVIVFGVAALLAVLWNILVKVNNAFNTFFGLSARMTEIKMPEWNATSSGTTTSRSNAVAGIPKLATGANIMGATVALVGEKKPETVTDLGKTNAFISSTLDLVKKVNSSADAPVIINLTVQPSQGMSEKELADKVVKQMRKGIRR